MRYLFLVIITIVLSKAAMAAEIESTYTSLEESRDCSVFAGGNGQGGNWADLVCSGYKGYPVFIYSGDARESVFYGFPHPEDRLPAWESFAGFNSAGRKVEWRIAREGGREIPFATIHRWSVSTGEGPEGEVEVLVVEKVSQIGDWEGCVVGYVMATGNAGANDQARQISDNQARDFACGVDTPSIESGDVELPKITREQ